MDSKHRCLEAALPEHADLILEPPAGASWRIDVDAIRRALKIVTFRSSATRPFLPAFETARRTSGSLPDLGLHLDIGYANLAGARELHDSILKAYGQRFRRVHLHDNKAVSVDIHLRLGANGYDGTITLEVFTPDREYLRMSRDMLRGAWDEN
jgi:hypothetical protein